MVQYTCRKVEREKSQSHSDLLIEERERIDPYVHNNPPKILHLLSLISPSLKIDHSALQERLRFVLCLVYSYLLLLEKQSVERSAVFFVIYKQNRRSTIFINASRAVFKPFYRGVARKSSHNKPSRILLFV